MSGESNEGSHRLINKTFIIRGIVFLQWARHVRSGSWSTQDCRAGAFGSADIHSAVVGNAVTYTTILPI